MSGRVRLVLKLAGAVAVAVAAVWCMGMRYSQFRRSGESGAQVWFYDQQRKQVYATARDTIPPAGAGVRAVVVAFRGEEKDPKKRRVAYLESYGQPLKEALERAKAARESGKALGEPHITRDSDLFQTNDLVKRVDETQWHVARSPEGRRVMSEWRLWRSADGQEPVVCVP